MQAVRRRRPNSERIATTRAALVSSARRLFIRKGYANTGTPEIVAVAKVTRGALYHHFEDKADLFFAVAREAAAEVSAEIARRTRGAGSPLVALVRGAEAYFAAMRESGRSRLLLLDAPAVLSPDQIQELGDLAGARELHEGLELAMRRKSGGEVPIDELTIILSASFDRAALAIANGEPPGRYLSAMNFLLERLVADRT